MQNTKHICQSIAHAAQQQLIISEPVYQLDEKATHPNISNLFNSQKMEQILMRYV